LSLRALAQPASKSSETEWSDEVWGGAGRLVGEFSDGQLAQVGEDISEGLREAFGTGTVSVAFDPNEPMGLGLGPLDPRQGGWGLEVGEVEEEGVAHAAGVRDGMVLERLEAPDYVNLSRESFEDILGEIDARRAAGHTLRAVFNTAAPVQRLYAVEMPARASLAAIAATEGLAPPAAAAVDAGGAMDTLLRAAQGGQDGFLWRERTPRLFLGDAGSATCAHVDMVPQLEFAHALCGTKFLGIASHGATPSLLHEHAAVTSTADEESQWGELDVEGGDDQGDDEEEEASDVFATRVPTDRPLQAQESRLLEDADVSMLCLRRVLQSDACACSCASEGCARFGACNSEV